MSISQWYRSKETSLTHAWVSTVCSEKLDGPSDSSCGLCGSATGQLLFFGLSLTHLHTQNTDTHTLDHIYPQTLSTHSKSVSVTSRAWKVSQCGCVWGCRMYVVSSRRVSILMKTASSCTTQQRGGLGGSVGEIEVGDTTNKHWNTTD